MKIAITGGSGFVGSHIASRLLDAGHEVVLVARGLARNRARVNLRGNVHFVSSEIDDAQALAAAFSGCDAVAHCAGINREIGSQTYQRVHIDGTRSVIQACRKAGVRRLAMISFLRARPDCASAYHESKWAAEEIVRQSGLPYTILKCGVIYGKGDHMLDHLSHAFHTFPLFALVGFRDRPIRPVAVADVARIVDAALAGGALPDSTVAVTGPEELTLREAVRRVSAVVGRRPVMFPMPLWFHYILGFVLEKIMNVPLVSVAQVRILSEGLAEALPPTPPPPPELAPATPFTPEQIRAGLPGAARFGMRDFRLFRALPRHRPGRRFFYETP